MARRRTKTETLKAEDQALRLHVRGLTFREIGQALQLSDSEARRKVKLALERRQQEVGETDAWAQTYTELEEALRTAYSDHDAAPPGSAARIGALKLILEINDRLARLRGLELRRPNVAALNSPAGAAKDDNKVESRIVVAADSDEMKEAVASGLETFNRQMAEMFGGRTAEEQAIHMFGPENVRPERPDTTAILPAEEDFVAPSEEGNAEERSL